jgi:hypothetical protein
MKEFIDWTLLLYNLAVIKKNQVGETVIMWRRKLINLQTLVRAGRVHNYSKLKVHRSKAKQ